MAYDRTEIASKYVTNFTILLIDLIFDFLHRFVGLLLAQIEVLPHVDD